MYYFVLTSVNQAGFEVGLVSCLCILFKKCPLLKRLGLIITLIGRHLWAEIG